ncbi:hypothetical protein [Aeromonas veronii]|uniref:hypothetical protein n=1 Tax=Aeromonas veronii TaxID=654 RepID=UPI003D1E990C
MKLRELNKEAAVETKSKSVRDVLLMMYNVIQKAEKSVGFGQKDEAEKIVILKAMIADMLKDSDQKALIRGNR